MQHKIFGRTGLSVSALGFGGSEIGFHGTPQSDVNALLNAALDAGLNVIDTAAVYADSEQKIGEAVSHRRGEYHLFTKCGNVAREGQKTWTAEVVTANINQSLINLRTDCVDLVQLHSCSEEVLRQGEVIEALVAARDDGKTRFIGYSGDRNDAVYAIQTGLFDTLQTSVNIADQESISLLLPKAKEANMGVIAKRPVANVAWRQEPAADAYARAYWERLQFLAYEFLRTPEAIQIALTFTLAQDVHTAIVGTTKPGRWSENAALLDNPISQDQINEIRVRWSEVAAADWAGRQ